MLEIMKANNKKPFALVDRTDPNLLQMIATWVSEHFTATTVDSTVVYDLSRPLTPR